MKGPTFTLWKAGREHHASRAARYRTRTSHTRRSKNQQTLRAMYTNMEENKRCGGTSRDTREDIACVGTSDCRGHDLRNPKRTARTPPTVTELLKASKKKRHKRKKTLRCLLSLHVSRGACNEVLWRPCPTNLPPPPHNLLHSPLLDSFLWGQLHHCNGLYRKRRHVIHSNKKLNMWNLNCVLRCLDWSRIAKGMPTLSNYRTCGTMN